MEQRNYTITIKTDNLLGSGNDAIAGSSVEPDKEGAKSSGAISKAGAKAVGKALVAYRTVKNFATQVINHEVSMVQLRTGSNELQERANFQNQLIQQGVGIIEGAVAGLAVGGLPGFIIGTATSLLNTMVSYGQAQNRLDTQNALEGASISLNKIRAGVNGSRRAYEQF